MGEHFVSNVYCGSPHEAVTDTDRLLVIAKVYFKSWLFYYCLLPPVNCES